MTEQTKQGLQAMPRWGCRWCERTYPTLCKRHQPKVTIRETKLYTEEAIATARAEGAERERERIEKLIGGALQGETLRGMTLFKLKQIFYKETTHAE